MRLRLRRAKNKTRPINQWSLLNKWAGGRVVEGARLESVFRRKSNEGSNPSLSAIYKNKSLILLNNDFRFPDLVHTLVHTLHI